MADTSTITPDQKAAGAAIMNSGGGFNANSSNPIPQRSPTSRIDPDTIGNVSRGTTVDSGAYKAENGLYYNSDGTPAIGSPEEAKDRVDATAAKYTSQAQQLTDLINAKYTTKEANDKDLIASNDARARVLNSRTGTTDSATGASAVAAVQDKGNKVLAADEASKTAEISAALGKISDLQSREQQANEAAARNDLVTAQNLRAKNKTDATATITSLAKSGVDISTLQDKEPDTYQSLLKSSGLTPIEFQAAYTNASPAGTQTKWQYKITGDTVTAYGVDAKGNLKTQEQKVDGLSAGNFTVIKGDNGILYKEDKSTGEITPLVNAAKPATPTKTPNGGTSTTQTKNEEQDALNWLARQAGYDPKVDVQRFQTDPAARAWAIQQAKLEKANSKKSTTTDTANPFS